MLLEGKEINVHYSRVEALKSVSIQLKEGIICALIGANGAGKSTLLKAISGTVRLTSGEIYFNEKRIDPLSAYKISRLGIAHVPEGKRLFPAMSVVDNLDIGAYLIKDKIERTRLFNRVFSYFPVLKTKRKHPAENLSGGEQQMLATARSLMANPKLLLMDEPSLGLSPLLVKTMAKIVREINQDGVNVFLVEQNARMALKLAHWAYVLEVGSIILEGDAEKLAKDEQIKKAYLGG